MKVSILGVTGYGGIEILRILKNHPEFSIHSIHSTREDSFLADEYPHLYGITNSELDKVDVDEISRNSDLLLLATPSGISSKWAEAFMDKSIRIIDLSGDLRIKDTDQYEHWYHKTPAHSRLIDESVYGLSEWNEAQISNAKWLANPGCYATSILLGLAPAVISKAIVPSSIIIDAKSGVTGAGKVPGKATHFSDINENFKIYKVNEHQHIPEIEQQLKIWDSRIDFITLSTHLLPINRGIFSTIYAELEEGFNSKKMFNLFSETYAQCPFVRVRKHGQYPTLKQVYGSNFCDIGLHVDERTGRVTIVSVIDNLMKGAAGQAIQNANLMFGIKQTVGLDFVPVYP